MNRKKKKKTQQSFIVSFLLSLVWFDRRFKKSINITNLPSRLKVEEEEVRKKNNFECDYFSQFNSPIKK